MRTAGDGNRAGSRSRWTRARQALRCALGVAAVAWIAVTVGWVRLGHPMNAVATALIAVSDLTWVVRTGHTALSADADEVWSRRAVPIGVAVLVLSVAALTPSRSSTPSGAIVGLSIVFWACVALAVWLTGTPARVDRATRSRHPVARQRRSDPPRP